MARIRGYLEDLREYGTDMWVPDQNFNWSGNGTTTTQEDDFWFGSGTGVWGGNGGGQSGRGTLTLYANSPFNSSASAFAYAKVDLKTVWKMQFSIAISGRANQGSNGSALGGTCSGSIKLYETLSGGGSTSTIASFSGSASKSGDGLSEAGGGIAGTFCITYDGTNINIKHNGNADGSAASSIVSDDTDVDVSGWSNCYIRIAISSNGGNNYPGNGGSSTASIGPVLYCTHFIHSQGQDS